MIMYAIYSSLLFFIIFISNVEGNSTEDEVGETSALNLEAYSSSSRLLSNEIKNPRGFSNSNFEIGESSKYEGIQELNENAIKEENRDIFSDHSSDGMNFECKSEVDEDDVTDDADEVKKDKLPENKIHKYAVVDSNKNLIVYEIKLYCEECDQPFGTIKNFEKHIERSHRKKKIFACKYENCGTGFTRLCNLYAHQFKTHRLHLQKVQLNNRAQSGKQDVTCHICYEMLQSVTEFERHYATVHKKEGELVLEEDYIIENEENNNFPKRNIYKYVAIGPGQNVTPYEIETYCEECDEPFDTMKKFEKHIERSHHKKKIFNCKYENCGNGFTRLCNLYTHLKVHRLRFERVRLKKTKPGKQDLVCHKCNEMFQRVIDFERHYVKFHKKEGKLVSKGDYISSGYPSNGAKFDYKSEAETKHSEADIGENKENNNFSKRRIFKYVAVGPDQNVVTYEVETYCEECDESFDTVINFENHFDRSHRKMKIFTCNFGNCGKSFAKRLGLHQHHLGVHGLRFEKKLPSNINFNDFSGEFPTYCEECRLECNTANSLQTHARKYHPFRKIFACMVTDCPSGFTRTAKLMKHLIEKHGRQKMRNRYRIETKSTDCRLCGHSFNNMKDLYAHAEKAHPTEKLLICSFCTATFNTNGNKNKHEKIMHGGTDRSPRYCRYCDKPFIRWDYVPFHETNCKKRQRLQLEEIPSTPGDVYECEECGKIFHKNRWKNFLCHTDQHKRYARCPICNWRIDVNGGFEILKSHVKIHHPYKYEEVNFEELFKQHKDA